MHERKVTCVQTYSGDKKAEIHFQSTGFCFSYAQFEWNGRVSGLPNPKLKNDLTS